MDKESVIIIYQEMMVSIKKIKNSGHKLSEGEEIKLTQLESITEELKEKAEKAGFGDRMLLNDTVEINYSDDLFQLIDASVCSSDIIKNFKEIVAAKFMEDKLGKKKLWEVIKIFDKYYTANVENISAVTINSRMKGRWTAIFGKSYFDLQLLATAYQNSAKEALFNEIKNLSPNKWKTSAVNLDASFQKNLKSKQNWLESADNLDNAIAQFKIDLKEFPLIPEEVKIGSFHLSGGKIQWSAKISATSPVLLANQESLLNGFISDFEQCVRNTVTFKKMNGIIPNISSTALTKGANINLEYGVLTFKTDIGKFDWGKIKKKDASGFSPASIRFQLTIDIAKLFAELGYSTKGSKWNDAKCSTTVSGGFNVSFDIEDFFNKRKIAKAKAKTGSIDLDKPTWDKDNKALNKIREQNADLLKKGDKLSDAMTLNNKNKEAIKKAAEEMGESARKAHDLLENHKWSDKGLKNKASDLLNETGEKIYKKIAGPLNKMTKLCKYAKPLAKLIPAVNAIVTLYEVATYVIAFVNWINSIDAKTWEDYFITFGESMEQTNCGRWFKGFDHWMKSMK